MKRIHPLVVAILIALFSVTTFAQGNLEINTPAISQVKASMQARFSQLQPLFAAGAIGLSNDGKVALRDINTVPLAQRGSVNGLVSAENADRATLYREIARANSHPEWEGNIASTFSGRWADRASPGWWVQDARGTWAKK